MNDLQSKTKDLRTGRNLRQRILQIAMCVLATIPAVSSVALATATNPGQNIANYGLDLIWWIALLGIAYVVIQLFMKRNYTVLLITIIIGGIVLYIIRNPQQLEVFGETIWQIVMNGG